MKQLALDAGLLLDCPLLVLDDAFHVAAYHLPPGFSDSLFRKAVDSREISYEAGAIISSSPALTAGTADYIKLEDSPYRRRFAPLVSAGIRLGYLICVDTDGELELVPGRIWEVVEKVLSKQLYIETSRKYKPFETAEDILAHLLDGEFSSSAYFRLQTANTYLANFHPYTFALIDLTAYRSAYIGKQHLKEEVDAKFPEAHSFQYREGVFLFLHGRENMGELFALAEEFSLKILVSEPLHDLFDLPILYRTAREALELMTDERFHGNSVCSVEELRTPLLLKNLEGRGDLIPAELRGIAAHDREKGSHYCETLYYYLTCSRSLKKTCDVLYAHRNTVLYRIQKMREEFRIPLDDFVMHTDILLGVSLILFEMKGPDFFLHDAKESILLADTVRKEEQYERE